MKNNFLLKKENLFVAFLFLFSLSINQYYGNKGIFPADSFSHFDTGFRILLGEYPFKNYWAVSGPLVDYLQAIFFYLFGANWQSYVFHASLFNGLLSVTTFVVLRNFKLNIYYSLIYSLLFSILAYPISGTPFVDHHSAIDLPCPCHQTKAHNFQDYGVCPLTILELYEQRLDASKQIP